MGNQLRELNGHLREAECSYRNTHKENAKGVSMSRRKFTSNVERDAFKQKRDKEYRVLLRSMTIRHYSNGTMSCACCNDKHDEFLCIDHINGGGNAHRRSLGKSMSSKNIYSYLFMNKFPEGFRVLCHNCNDSRGIYGYCPHERERT